MTGTYGKVLQKSEDGSGIVEGYGINVMLIPSLFSTLV